MAGKRRPPQTSLLNQPPTPPPHPTGRVTPTPSPSTATQHLLLQIGQRPGSVSTIGREIKDNLELGRSDPAENYYPAVDLAPYDAIKNGVSRRHARIFRASGLLYVEDLGSRNGTILNNIKLSKGYPQLLHDGDLLLLGKLQIVIWFV